MRTLLLMMSITIFASVACKSGGGGNTFGEDFEPVDAITVEALYTKLSASSPVEGVVVEGTVEDVCQAKGCWMTLVAGDAEPMRVTFQDYGFFVPKDIHGRSVVMKGNGEVSVTPIDELKHYAEDAGQSQEEIDAITEPLEEYVFVATGVKLVE